MHRPRPYLLVLLLACGGPSAGTEVGNPTYGCSADAAGSDSGGGGYPTCVPGGGLDVRCDGASCELVDFGAVPVGETATVTLRLENLDCDFVVLSPPRLEGAVQVLEGPASPVTLDSGARVSFILGFTPGAEGSAGGDIRFALDPGEELYLPWVGTGL